MAKMICIDLLVDDEQIERLEKILIEKQNDNNEETAKLYKNWTPEDILQMAMIGERKGIINRAIESEEEIMSTLRKCREE